MQAQVSALPGYLISCVTYLVSGDYAVSVRQSNGTYMFTEASAVSPTMVHTGCQDADPVSGVEVDAIVKVAAGSSARFVLGYTIETVPAGASLFTPCVVSYH